MALSCDNSIQFWLEKLTSFLNRPFVASLINCQLVDFITKDLFHSLLPESIQKELLSLSTEELSRLSAGHLPESCLTESGNETCDEGFSSLRSLVEACSSYSMTNILRHAKGLQYEDSDAASTSSIKGRSSDHVIIELRAYCMKEKKSHEVEVMAAFVNRLCQRTGVKTVLDIGSGRGCLPSFLSLAYGLNVIGLEASSHNTLSAERFLERLKASLNVAVKCPAGSALSCPGQFVAVAETVGSCTDLDAILLRNNFVTELSSLSENNIVAQQTLFHNNNVAQEEFCDASDGGPAVVCGLHTCGDLAVHAIDAFLRSEKSAALLVVGCCYNLMEERFSAEPLTTTTTTEKKVSNVDGREQRYYGFPVSSYLRNLRFKLGDRPRMLAMQPVHKLVDAKTLCDRSLHWRALVQQILFDKIGPVNAAECRVGRIAKHCDSIHEYIRLSLIRLSPRFGHIDLSSEEIEDYVSKYMCYKSLLSRFHQLRCALAPIVEAIIILDRVAYLQEQPSVKEVFVVKLFDALKSPRCFGILSLKYT